MPNEDKQKLGVFFQLEGEDLKNFLAYKQRSNLKANAEIARKLVLDQLRALTKRVDAQKTKGDLAA